MKHLVLLVYFALVPCLLLAQDYESLFKKAEYSKAKVLIQKRLDATGDSIVFKLNLAKVYEQEKKIDSCESVLSKINEAALSKEQRANYLYLKARVYDDELNQTMLALETYKKALKLYAQQGNKRGQNKTRYRLFYLLYSNSLSSQTAYKYLDSLRSEAVKFKDTSAQIQSALGMASWYFTPETSDSVQKYVSEAYKLSKMSEDLVRQEVTASYLGLNYLSNLNNIEKAKLWLDKSVFLAEKMGNDNAIFYSYLNRATLPRALGDFRESLSWMYKADSIPLTTYNYNLKASLYEFMAKDYDSLRKTDSALAYLKKFVKYRDSSDIQEQNKNLIRFATLETENENLRVRQENEKVTNESIRNRNIAWSLGILALLLAIIGTLAYTNQQRKRKIAVQQQELEQEKVSQLLKDQELQSIDAMISGQEKERQRLANDLHDNLGSLLATLKLHFENYKGQVENTQQEKILNNTDTLLDEAYQKVRSMAHTRNTGVIAKYGLLPAIENFAAKVSASQKLQIAVSHNKFNDRLENAVEIGIFRMVQELITNVIKHAQATEVQLQLARHDAYINILIEDNGVGFNPSNLPKKEGMGLSSIKRRVEVIGGNFHIDSQPGHGTTVSIDIPVG
ncbi:ATP-binding protein [Ascidiimonas sp. W6]|uniref:tetratricopeptide repeat-containing sensor histidine kinase n=1 Tax=Ascidiimonas meishanensis TaxID=3128903 RepID=UPI0030EE0A32